MVARLRDPRVWLGLAFTAAAMVYALWDVDLRAVAREFARARLLLLLGISVPSYVLVVWLRAVRWRHLTDPIRPLPRGPLFRAVAVGFMANNLFPLRMGEIVRSWYLGRECSVSTAAVFGTVILERVIDTFIVFVLALGLLPFLNAREAGDWQQALLWLLPIAALPLVVLMWMQAAPTQAGRLVERVTGWLPTRTAEPLRQHFAAFAGGLGALRGGSHLFWIGLHTLTIWLVASTLPIWAGFLALDIDFGSPAHTLIACWMTLAAVGLAVALPSAPGFFGLYHSACRLVLERFGISSESAVAAGTLLHAVFWVTLTLLGFAVLRLRHTPLEALDRAAAGEEPR